MTENSTNSTMAVETNTSALKETLYTQQRLLQQLYHELDVEREASATAASEALSMILRLQGEKAAVQMEAEQYKRLAEEKMHHAEESMEIFEDVIYQKEMEIASLDYQVQAYRYKLLSLGCEDLGINEIKFPDNLGQRNENTVGEPSPEILRRNSVPPNLLKLAYAKRGPLERDRSPDADIISRIVEESAREDEISQIYDSEKKFDGSPGVDINSYSEQIRKLDKIVEEMTGEQYPSLRARFSKSSICSPVNKLDQGQTSSSKSVDEEIFSDACSSSVHDVFEVPQIEESVEKEAKDEGKSVFKGDEKVRKLFAFPKEAIKPFDKNETHLGKRTILFKHKGKNVLLPRDDNAIDSAIVRLSEAQGSCQRMNRTTEIIEGERQDSRQELVTSTGDEEELRLLYEIRDKLNLIQSEIRKGNTKTKISSPNYDLPMLQLTEAMLHFWL